MRYRIPLGSMALSGLLAGALAPAPAAYAAEKPAGPDGRDVSYQGLTVTIPDNWRVVDFTRTPDACLRLDVPTLYLGHAGTQESCPSKAVAERADTVHLESLADAPERQDIPTLDTTRGSELSARSADATGGETRFALRRHRVMATVTSGRNSGTTEEILASVRGELSSAKRKRRAAPESAPDPAPARSIVPGEYRGEGFDQCSAPGQGAMDAWRKHSPYRAIGVYIGGSARTCAQPNLTPQWVNTQHTKGWHLTPIWVGPQPWKTAKNPINVLPANPSDAEARGRKEAQAAIEAARQLGLGEGSVLYNDVEHYDDRAKWDAPVAAYLSGWTAELWQAGYRSGAYVHANSGMKALSALYDQRTDQGTVQGTHEMPDIVWAANWNKRADVSDASMGLPEGTRQWSGKRRIHQYHGPIKETYGGVTIEIDRNYLDVAPVQEAPALSDMSERLTSVDLNGDGRADVVAIAKDGTLHGFHTDAKGTLSYGGKLWDDASWKSMKQVIGGDFTGDGRADLVGLWNDGSIWLYRGQEDGSFVRDKQMWPDKSWGRMKKIAAARTPATGRDGLIAIRPDGSLHAYDTRPDGTLDPRSRNLGYGNSWGTMRNIVTGDFDDDGKTDVAAVWADGTFRFYPGTDSGKLGASKPMWGDKSWGTMHTLLRGDFNGDRKDDIAGRRHNGTLSLYTGNGNATLNPGTPMG